MLEIKNDEIEFFNDSTSEFVYVDSVDLILEHSLLSISEWESKYHKSFFSSKDKTTEEVYDYIKMMIVNVKENVNYDLIVHSLSNENLDKINSYIEDPRTATKFFDLRESQNSRQHTYTSEEVYYQMLKLGIPFECERWNINRLSTLIRVCLVKETGDKNKMGRDEILRRNREINEARKAKLKTNG